MRLVQVTISQEKQDAVIELLEERDFEFTLTDETSHRSYGAVVSVPVETDEVESLLDDLREIGIDHDGYAIISDVEAILSAAREERQEERDDEAEELIASNRISRDELHAQAIEMADLTPNYLFFTVVSAIVAAAGLLADSAAVVVGSMVIAPLLGPAVGASVGSIVNDDALFREGTKAQAVGLVLAVGSATLFAFFMKGTLYPNVDLDALQEVAARTNPGVLSLVVALGAGAAGALSLSAGASASLVGVMIAAALIPPAAAIGLGVVYNDPILAISSAILVLVNVLSINFASMGILWFRGYRPDHWFEAEAARKATLKRIAVLVIGIVVLGSFLIFTTIDLQQNAKFEATVDSVAEDSEVTVLSTDIAYETSLFSRQPSRVTLHVTMESNETATTLRRRIQTQTTLDPTIVVIRENAETSIPRDQSTTDISRPTQTDVTDPPVLYFRPYHAEIKTMTTFVQ